MLRPFIAIGSVLVWCIICSVVSSEGLRYLTPHCDPDVACNKRVTWNFYILLTVYLVMILGK